MSEKIRVPRWIGRERSAHSEAVTWTSLTRLKTVVAAAARSSSEPVGYWKAKLWVLLNFQ